MEAQNIVDNIGEGEDASLKPGGKLTYDLAVEVRASIDGDVKLIDPWLTKLSSQLTLSPMTAAIEVGPYPPMALGVWNALIG